MYTQSKNTLIKAWVSSDPALHNKKYPQEYPTVSDIGKGGMSPGVKGLQEWKFNMFQG